VAQKSKYYIKIALMISLLLAPALSFNSISISHDLSVLAEIISLHEVEIAEHGHSHEEIDIVNHAFHGHAHDASDHDHNVTFLPSRAKSNDLIFENTRWLKAIASMYLNTPLGLDRPPRG
jgi:hypothetical protein